MGAGGAAVVAGMYGSPTSGVKGKKPRFPLWLFYIIIVLIGVIIVALTYRYGERVD